MSPLLPPPSSTRFTTPQAPAIAVPEMPSSLRSTALPLDEHRILQLISLLVIDAPFLSTSSTPTKAQTIQSTGMSSPSVSRRRRTYLHSLGNGISQKDERWHAPAGQASEFSRFLGLLGQDSDEAVFESHPGLAAGMTAADKVEAT